MPMFSGNIQNDLDLTGASMCKSSDKQWLWNLKDVKVWRLRSFWINRGQGFKGQPAEDEAQRSLHVFGFEISEIYLLKQSGVAHVLFSLSTHIHTHTGKAVVTYSLYRLLHRSPNHQWFTLTEHFHTIQTTHTVSLSAACQTRSRSISA